MANLLIVDDTPDVCRVVLRLFAKCGHAGTCVDDPTRAVAVMRAARFDLVLLDVMMPVMDGFAVLRAIRADPVVGRTPVAMYSAISEPAQQARALALGADEWIVKGTPFDLLRRRLDAFLHPPTNAARN
jgi:CheY-like chemotaxis protein